MQGSAKRHARNVIINRDGDCCIYCNKKLYVECDPNDHNQFTFDHIIPRSLGGSNNIANLTISCRDCNSRRGSEDFFFFLGMHKKDNELFYKFRYLNNVDYNVSVIQLVYTEVKNIFANEKASIDLAMSILYKIVKQNCFDENDLFDYESIMSRKIVKNNDFAKINTMPFLLFKVRNYLHEISKNAL